MAHLVKVEGVGLEPAQRAFQFQPGAASPRVSVLHAGTCESETNACHIWSYGTTLGAPHEIGLIQDGRPAQSPVATDGLHPVEQVGMVARLDHESGHT